MYNEIRRRLSAGSLLWGFKMEKTLTIVIPSYNVEKYIERCLDSFLNMEVLKELEILVINDGSTDQTQAIVQRYCNKYPSSIHLINKENGGHGSGINVGIEHATGKYFKVVDGDDWVEKDNLPDYVRRLRKLSVDMVANDYTLVQDETFKVIEHRKVCKNTYHYGKEWGFAEAVNENIIPLHAMTVSTKILKENSIRLDEHVFYEDAEYMLYPIPFCKNVYYDATNIYMYRLGRSGQSVDIHSMIRRKEDHHKVMDSLFHYYEEHEFIQQYKRKYLEKGIASIVENEFQIFLAEGNKEEVVKEMRSFDQMLLQKYPGIYTAVTKKSIWAIRHSNYKLFPFGAWVYSLVRGTK